MKMMQRLNSLAALAVLAGFAAGCTTGGPGPGATAAQPTPFDGAWLSSDGIAESRFQSGAFSTVATENGSKLADGTYVLSNNRTANITVKSLIRGTTQNVTCLLATEGQLNCTSSSGQTFILNRKPVAPA